jgi:hypothetical protein
MDRRLQSLRRAVAGLLARWRRPVPPSGAQALNAGPPAASLPGRWPDAETLLSRRMPTVAQSQTDASGKPPLS